MITATILLLGACEKKETATGYWHNTDLVQVIELLDDGSLFFQNGASKLKGFYIYDANKNQGSIILQDTQLSFTIKDNALTLSSPNAFRLNLNAEQWSLCRPRSRQYQAFSHLELLLYPHPQLQPLR
jgi:hypothetical protein